MKKLLFLLLVTSISYGQALFDKGIKVTTNINDTTATKVVVKSANNVYNYQDIVKFQKEKGFLSTGLIKNGLISANGDPTKFNITAGIGIISNFDNPENPISTIVRFPAFNSITPTYLTTGNITYVAINSTPTVVMQATPFTPIQRRSLIILGAVIHSNLTTINVLNNISAPTNADTNQLHDFMEAVGALNITGNKYTANGANLQLNKSAGVLFKLGSNFAVDWKNPHEIAQTGGTAITFRYRTQNGTESADMTSISPGLYDLNNVLTTVPNNKFTIQTVTVFQTGLTRIQWGQSLYDDLQSAKNALLTRDFVVENNIKENGVTRAYIIVRNSTTSLQNVADAYISEAQKFGGVASGGVALTLANIVTALGYTPENLANKQNSLSVDGTGVKYPTVDAINFNVIKLTGDQTISGTKTFDNLLLKENPITTSAYRIGQTMAGDDNWSIYGRNDAVDKGEMIFEVGDNGNPFTGSIPSAGQRFRFAYTATSGGIAKNPLIIDYNEITADANLTATSFVKIGGLSTQFLKANGSVDATNYQPLLTNPITGTGTTNTIPKFTGTSTIENSQIIDNGTDVIVGGGITGGKLTVLGGAGNNSAVYIRKTDQQSGRYGLTIEGGSFNEAWLNFKAALTIFRADGGIVYDAGIGSSISFRKFGAGGNTPVTISADDKLLVKTTTSNGIDAIQTPGTVTFAAGTTANQGVIKSQLDLKSNIDSPTFTGVPNAPTAPSNTNTTQIASTAFVLSNSVALNGDQSLTGTKTITNNNTTIGRLLVNNSRTTAGSFGETYGININNSGNIGLNVESSNGDGVRAFSSNGNAFKSTKSDSGIGLIFQTLNTTDTGDYISIDSNKVRVRANLTVKMAEFTVATLPTMTAGQTGYATVTDALAPTYMATVVGGGSIVTPVFYNGTNWVSH